MLRRTSSSSAISFWGPILIAAVFIIPIYILFIADNNSDENISSKKENVNNSSSSNQKNNGGKPGIAEHDPNLVPLNPPKHRTVKANINSKRIAPFEIKTDTGSYYLVKLEDVYNNSRYFMIFIHGGQTVNIKVPLGNYVMKYCTGKDWYGYKELFGPDGSYSKSEDLFNFIITDNQVSGFTVTLYGVVSGNLETHAINRKDF